MKNLLFLCLLLPAMLFAQKGYVINGKVNGLPNGAEVKITSVTDNNVVTKGTAKDGVFKMEGTLTEPGLYWITLGNEQPQHIFLENGPIKITGTTTNIKDLKIEGSVSHNDFEVFRKTFNPLVGELNATAAKFEQTEEEAKRLTLLDQFNSIKENIKNEVVSFVQKRPKSYVSIFLISLTAQLIEDPALLEENYNMLDATVQNSSMGKELATYIEDSKVGAIGTMALDFTQNNTDSIPVSLSSFRGKYVLIDFWASWCKPCRMENPNVVKAYQRFSNKNFTILGVSLDRDKENWLKAIKNDGLTWTQVSDLQYWNNAVAKLYKVQGIPQNFLVDPNGKIVGKNLRGEELEAKLCELLGCN